MQVLGKAEAEVIEQHNMLGKAGKPLFPANHVCGAHQMVVHSVGKVIGRNAIRFKKHEILVVFGDLKLSSHKIGERSLLFRIAVCHNADHERIAFGKIFFYFILSDVSCCKHRFMRLSNLLGSPFLIFDLGLFVGFF